MFKLFGPKVIVYWKQGKGKLYWYSVKPVGRPDTQKLINSPPGFPSLESLIEHAEQFFRVKDVIKV